MNRWWDEAVRSRLDIARQLRVAGGGLIAVLVVVNLLLGLLPVVFVVATSRLVGQVPAVVAAGTGTPAWNALLVASSSRPGRSSGNRLSRRCRWRSANW